MRNLLSCGCLLMSLILACMLHADELPGEIKLDFASGKIPAQLQMALAKRWAIADSKLVNADVNQGDSFTISLDKTEQATICADVNILGVHEKGGFWGIAFVMKDQTRVQVFNQGHQLRYYIRKPGDPLKPRTFAVLPEAAAEHAVFTASIDGAKLLASADGGKVFELPLETSGIERVEFQAYQMQVAINSIAITGPLKAVDPKADKDEHLKSQLEVAGPPVIRPADPNALVIFYIGDSITRHGFNAGTIQKLGWDHLAGMAATEESRDFAHLFAAHVQSLNPQKKVAIFFHDRGGAGAAAPKLAAISAFATLKPEIVVVQLGEHEKEHNGEDKLRENYRALLSTMQQWESKPLILCVGVWNPYGKGERTAYTDWTLTVDRVMAEVCKDLKIPYASMEKHALNPQCSGWGTSGGVKWHPNDAGMQAYADELISMYKAAMSR